MGQAETWADETLTVPGGVGTFGEAAFSETHYRRAVLSEGITQVSRSAFEMAGSLEEVCLPDTVTKNRCGRFPLLRRPGGSFAAGGIGTRGEGGNFTLHRWMRKS